MYKKLYLIIMAGTLCFSAVHGQSGYTGAFGGNVQGGEYINVQASLGGDQVVGPSGDMELGNSAALDIYGALTVNQGATLTLRNGAVLNLYGDMVLNGSLVAEQGSTINFYGKSWTNGANAQVTNNGAVNGLPGNALYFTTPQPAVPSAWLTSTTQLSNYSGNVQGQIIDGGAVPMNIDVYLNNTSNVSLLNTNTKLAGRLIFNTSGSYLVVNNRKMIFTVTGTHSGAATDRYIETNLSADAGGAVVKEDLAPGSPFSFPVGSTIPQDYTPAEITPAAGVADNYSVNVNTFSNSSTNMASFGTLANMQRVWQVYAEKNASAVTSSNIVFSHYQGLERNSYTPTQSDVWFLTDQGIWTHNFSCNTEDSTDLSGLRYYTRGLNSIALPACPTCATSIAGVFYTKSLCSNAATIAQVLAKAFVSFTASEAGCSNKLQWVVTGSNTNGNFDVERSVDGKNYTAVKKVPYVKGTTTYTAVDDNLEAATYYYRVKYSANGQEPFYTTAAMVKNSCPASKAIQVYPNPAVYSFTVNAAGNSKVTSIDVLTSSGRLVKHVTNTAGNTITNINVSDLAAGLYLVRTTDANNVQVYKKLIIQNK